MIYTFLHIHYKVLSYTYIYTINIMLMYVNIYYYEKVYLLEDYVPTPFVAYGIKHLNCAGSIYINII